MNKYFTTAIVLLFLALPCYASELGLSPVFGSNMVLQRSTAVPVWGTSGAGETISVRFADQSVQATADENGNWKVLLGPMDALSKPSVLTVTSSSEQSVSCDNLLVGDVWLCSGQSNMYMQLKDTDSSAEAIAGANYPQVRLLQMMLRRGAQAGESFVMGKWQECSPDSVANFSAVAYYFGRKINQELNVPVGLIHSSVGGTQVERWIPREDANPSLEYLQQSEICMRI